MNFVYQHINYKFMEEKKNALFYTLKTKDSVISGLVRSAEQVVGLTHCVAEGVTLTFELR